jgi:predicted secreted protein
MDKLLTNAFFKQTLNFFVVVVIAFGLLLGFSKVARIYAEGGGASLFELIEEAY